MPSDSAVQAPTLCTGLLSLALGLAVVGLALFGMVTSPAGRPRLAAAARAEPLRAAAADPDAAEAWWVCPARNRSIPSGLRHGYPYALGVGPHAFARDRGLDELPLRRLGVEYRATSSYNTHLENADFNNFIRHEGDKILLLKEFGPGCLLFQWTIPSANCSMVYRVDGGAVEWTNPSQRMFDASRPPFVEPFVVPSVISFRHWLPICYRSRIEVWIDMLGDTRGLPEANTCITGRVHCDVKMYWAFSTMRLLAPPHTTEPFFAPADGASYRPPHPSTTHIPASVVARLRTARLTPGHSTVLLDYTGTGVVRGLAVEIPMHTCPGRPVCTRRKCITVQYLRCVRLQMRWDDAERPQVSLPLAHFFGVYTPALRQRNFTNYLVASRVVKAADGRELWLGYTRVPMPFWRRARIELVVPADSPCCPREPFALQYHVAVDADCAYPNAPGLVGYFNTYAHSVHAPVNAVPFLRHPRGWGHLLGISYGFTHYSNHHEGGFQESDPFMWWDRSVASQSMGTGMEDWFTYAHGWLNHPPRSDPFVGHMWEDNIVTTYRVTAFDAPHWNDGFDGMFEAIDYRDPPQLASVAWYYGRRMSGMAFAGAADVAALCPSPAQLVPVVGGYITRDTVDLRHGVLDLTIRAVTTWTVCSLQYFTLV